MPTPDPDVRDLVMRFGWNATAYQILNPGFDHWFSPDRAAVVGYTRKGRWWLVAGAPVCAVTDLPAVTAQLEQAARSRGCRVCYVCAAGRMRDMMAGSASHATLAIGAEPVWDPRVWPSIVASRSSLRAQLNRARNKGVTVGPCDVGDAALGPDLRRVLHEWLGRHGLPPMHFLTEPDVLAGEMRDRLLLVARRDGRPVAFLVASPVPARQGWLVEEIARGLDAPNGAAELLIDAAMRELATGGATYVTLGLVALSTQVRAELRANPAWVRTLMTWARAHGRRFYHFDGLEQFRTKMNPGWWEPIYAITNERRFSPGALHAVARAFCDGSPTVAVAKAIARAARQELSWGLSRATGP
jgi:phosphatidylglycerol lysyltransferase